MDKKYALVLKTGEAEIRALEKTSEKVKNCIFPIIELTRGRKLPIRDGKPKPAELYPFGNRFQKIKDVFKGFDVCLDITSDTNLLNKELEELYNPSDGYSNWISFLSDLKDKHIFNNILPSIIFDFEDENFDENLKAQVENLKKSFSSLVYRTNIFDDQCYQDIEILKDLLLDVQLYVIIDCEYVPHAARKQYLEKIVARINNLKILLKQDTKYIVCATSFPNNISEIGDDEKDTFSLCEVELFKSLQNGFKENIIYADYGSINPIRNDTIKMSRGWIPRIDVPLQNEIYYYRKRRPKKITEYSATYYHVALMVIGDSRFPKELLKNWGIEQILNCSFGDSPASNPSFWISVRMCIHLEQQVRRLKLLD